MTTVLRPLGLAFCTNVIPIEELPSSLVRLQQWGFDAVELWPAAIERYSYANLRSMLSTAKLHCAQLSPSLDLTGSRAQFESSYRLGTTFIEHAAKIGAPLLRLTTGKIRGEHATQETWQSAITTIHKLCQVACDHGVTLALETVRDSLAETSRHALRILEEVDHDSLKLNLQLPLRGEDIWDSLRVCSRYAVHMHVHNWQVTPSPDVPNSVLMSQITFIDAGVIDYHHLLTDALTQGFGGCISVEHGTHHGRHIWSDSALRDGRYLRRLIRELIESGIALPMS